jgi:type VI secretion system protein ImpH
MAETAARDRPRLGRALRPRDEPLRLGQDAELDFAPAAISSFGARGNGLPRLGQRFFGLFGPGGPLPLHLTEYTRDRARNHADPTLARFADQFHHRALLLFFRAWAQAQPAVHLDRRKDDGFSRWLGSFAGIGETPFLGRDSLSDDVKRHGVALLARGAKSAEGLTKLLRRYFGVPVRLESHVGHWLSMRSEDCSRLVPRTQPGLRNVLGVNAVAGSKVWDRQFRFRLHLGPLSYQQYRNFLPARRSLVELRDWVRQYCGLALSFDVVVWLRGAEVPGLQLGASGSDRGLLGWTTWLGASRPHADRGDLRLRPATRTRVRAQLAPG